MPIRWRLAGGSAALTFVILACFAAMVSVVTARQVAHQFSKEVQYSADQLTGDLNGNLEFDGLTLSCDRTPVGLNDYAELALAHAQIRIFDNTSGQLLCTQSQVLPKGSKKAPETSLFTSAPAQQGSREFTESGYRVAERQLTVKPSSSVQSDRLTLLYAVPLVDPDFTVDRVQFFLYLGVIGGTLLALLAGLATAQRATRPIVQLTEAAREIERTRDTSRRLPHPEADDEIEELARTLEDMLQSLDAARHETQAMLDRQREFVADASHELRTPLTGVLANLELLAEELDGEQAETAQAALRSTRRMRRLVGDLLLLARADAQRIQPRSPTDLATVLLEAASELEPMADDHELSIDAQPAVVPGVRDDLHRLTLNLIENAVRHTPPGTHIRACTATVNGDAILTVEDDGPGIPPELERRVFERFVRGGRDGRRGSGLGLAIVRAVAQSHRGSVALERPDTGTGSRFVITLPRELTATSGGEPSRGPALGAQGARAPH